MDYQIGSGVATPEYEKTVKIQIDPPRVRQPHSFRQSRSILKILCIILIALGICFRTVNLDAKIFSVDEVRGVLRVTGHTANEFVKATYNQEPIQVSKILQYQRLGKKRTLQDTLHALTTNPEHPPGYYFLVRLWMQIFNYPAAARWLSVLFSILALPALYWLARELFDSAQVGWIAMAVISISPLHIFLSQEARQYSLWSLTLLLSSACLLMAMRTQRGWSWGGYVITLILGLYTHLFFIFVLFAQGLYVLCHEYLRPTLIMRRAILAAMTAGAAFSAWGWVIINHLSTFQATTRWASSYKTPLVNRFEQWFHNLSVLFLDFDLEASFRNPILYGVLILTVAAFYVLYRYAPQRAWLFLSLLISVTVLAQVVPDVLLASGRRSMLPRYGLSAYVGLVLVFAYFIHTLFYFPQVHSRKRSKSSVTNALSLAKIKQGKRLLWTGRLAIILVLVGSLVSSSWVTRSLIWGKDSATINLAVANHINQAERSVVLSDAPFMSILSLAHLVKPETRFQLVHSEEDEVNKYAESPTFLASVDREETLFVYLASEELSEVILSLGRQITRLQEPSKWYPNRPVLLQVAATVAD